MNRFISLFPIWAILLSSIAYYKPEYFIAMKPLIIPLLALIMFGMGMTLSWSDFKQALNNPKAIGTGVILQYALMPFFAWSLSLIYGLSLAQTVGMMLVGATAGGTASNVICYLADGDVALSVLLTLSSTLLSIFATPLITWAYLGEKIDVPTTKMLLTIAQIVLLPVLAGTLLNSSFTRLLRPVQSIFPVVSCFGIIVIIAIIVALNQENIAATGLILIAAVVSHNLLGLLCGFYIPLSMGMDRKTCRTLSIEVGMQNSGLSVALAIKYFSAASALPAALFSIWHNVSGSLLATYWRSKRPI